MKPGQKYLRNDAVLFWMPQGEGLALFTSPTDVNLMTQSFVSASFSLVYD